MVAPAGPGRDVAPVARGGPAPTAPAGTSVTLSGSRFTPSTRQAAFDSRFDMAGTYAYVCVYHSRMTGSIVVSGDEACGSFRIE